MLNKQNPILIVSALIVTLVIGALFIFLQGENPNKKRGTLSGSIVNAADGTCVEGVNVSAKDQDGIHYTDDEYTDTTDKNGSFRLELPPNDYTLILEADGYLPYESGDIYTVEENDTMKVKEPLLLTSAGTPDADMASYTGSTSQNPALSTGSPDTTAEYQLNNGQDPDSNTGIPGGSEQQTTYAAADLQSTTAQQPDDSSTGDITVAEQTPAPSNSTQAGAGQTTTNPGSSSHTNPAQDSNGTGSVQNASYTTYSKTSDKEAQKAEKAQKEASEKARQAEKAQKEAEEKALWAEKKQKEAAEKASQAEKSQKEAAEKASQAEKSQKEAAEKVSQAETKQKEAEEKTLWAEKKQKEAEEKALQEVSYENAGPASDFHRKPGPAFFSRRGSNHRFRSA